MNMTLSNSQASRKKKRQSTLRKRKPKRQGSRAQVGKLLPLLPYSYCITGSPKPADT